jgi:glucose-1-phosphate adenylyltransferase
MTDFGREVIPSLLSSRKLYAHIFEGYWEDIGTVKAFFEANLALAQPLPPFNFFDATTPVYTRYEYLPASKLNKCRIDNVVVADGCILTDSSLKHCLFGIRSYVGEGADLEDVIVMGADYYETPEQMASNLARGKPNLGVGRNCFIRRAIIDKNTRIGDGSRLSAAGNPDGTYVGGAVVIRDGVLVVPKGATIPPGTVVERT